MATTDSTVGTYTVGQLAGEIATAIREAPDPQAVNLERHQADLERRRVERAKTQHLRDACLNPEAAARCELEKPVFEFKVSAKWMQSGEQGTHLAGHEATVIAQNASDAWARFCDQIRIWPGRKACRDLVITKGREVSIAEHMAGNMARPGTPGLI